MAQGGAAPAVLAAADEVAVDWFLAGRIPFTGIARLIEEALAARRPGPGDSLEALLEADRETRSYLEGRGAQQCWRARA
jgi:1-deoxy-D-xylulose-5-phosphate reductoisomerase